MDMSNTEYPELEPDIYDIVAKHRANHPDKAPRPRALLLKCDDWECLYVDGKAVAQGHHVPWREIMDMAEKYRFVSSQMIDRWVVDADVDPVDNSGIFPDLASALKGDYGY